MSKPEQMTVQYVLQFRKLSSMLKFRRTKQRSNLDIHSPFSVAFYDWTKTW